MTLQLKIRWVIAITIQMLGPLEINKAILTITGMSTRSIYGVKSLKFISLSNSLAGPLLKKTFAIKSLSKAHLFPAVKAVFVPFSVSAKF